MVGHMIAITPGTEKSDSAQGRNKMNPFQHSELAGFLYLYLEDDLRLKQEEAGPLMCMLADELARIYKLKLIRDEDEIHSFIRKTFCRLARKPRRRGPRTIKREEAQPTVS
jgi:hypothetical protein